MKKILMIFLSASLLLNSSCSKETESEIAPEIPPVSTFEMSFSDFNTSSKTNEDITWHWGRAAIQVTAWNVAIGLHLAIPVAAFKEAFNHQATYVAASKEWLWQYDVNSDYVTYTAKLYGKVIGSTVHWRMLLSKSGAYSDFEWYTGVSKKDQSGGTWSLNKDPMNQTKFIDIAWSKSASKEEIKYTNVIPGDENNGSYIKYGIIPGADLDAFYDISLVKENATVNIKWNRTNSNGNAVEPTYYGDSNPRCWGPNLANVICE